MSKIMYKTNTFDGIEKVEIERDTKFTVWIRKGKNGQLDQYRKKCDSWNFFDTFDEAKQFLVNKYKKKIRYLESNIFYERKQLDKILALKADE